MSVEIRGLQQTKRALLRVPPDAGRVVRREILRSTLAVQTGAKKRAPIDTGRLRNSIATKIEADGLTGIVGTNVKYAKAIEFGFAGTVKIPAHAVRAHRRTRGGKTHTVRAHTRTARSQFLMVRARPFLFPAFEEEWPKFLARLKAALGPNVVLGADRG